MAFQRQVNFLFDPLQREDHLHVFFRQMIFYRSHTDRGPFIDLLQKYIFSFMTSIDRRVFTNLLKTADYYKFFFGQLRFNRVSTDIIPFIGFLHTGPLYGFQRTSMGHLYTEDLLATEDLLHGLSDRRSFRETLRSYYLTDNFYYRWKNILGSSTRDISTQYFLTNHYEEVNSRTTLQNRGFFFPKTVFNYKFLQSTS